jgi:hypothetical protein
VLGIAGRAPRLPDVFVDNGDNRMICEASFARTVVVHDVAKTQRALLHSILPGLHIPVLMRTGGPGSKLRGTVLHQARSVSGSDATLTRKEKANLQVAAA